MPGPVVAFLVTLLEPASAFHGIAPFEVSGTVVEWGLDDLNRKMLVVDVPVDAARLVVTIDVPDELRPPFAVGDALTLSFEAQIPDDPVRAWWERLRLLDEFGRLRWAYEMSENFSNVIFEPEIETVSSVPCCLVSDERAGFAVDVSLRGGGAMRANPGVVVPLAGGGSVGRIFLGEVYGPLCPQGGTYVQDTLRGALIIDVPGPEPSVCLADIDCGPDGYCERGVGGCDSPGRCSDRPKECSYTAIGMLQRPCGCDGRLYDDACRAHLAGTDFSLTDASECEGAFQCGLFFCLAGREACLAGEASGTPALSSCVRPGGAFPVGEGCDLEVVGCACYDLAGSGCSCTESSAGEVKIVCP